MPYDRPVLRGQGLKITLDQPWSPRRDQTALNEGHQIVRVCVQLPHSTFLLQVH